MSNLPPVVVYGLSATGLAIARVLGRHGVSVYGVDSKPWEIGRFSRYVQWRSSLQMVQSEVGSRPILFLGGDPEIFDVCRNHVSLLPDPSVTERILSVLDKGRLDARCRALQPIPEMSLPKTLVPASWEDWKGVSMPGPVVVKPRFGAASPCRPRWGKLWLHERSERLDVWAKRHLEAPSQAIVQEVIEGPDDAIVVCFLHRRSRGDIGALMTGQKVRQRPVGYGSAVSLKTTADALLRRLATRLVETLDLYGLIAIEWKRARGRYYLMEINARTPQFGAVAPEVILDAYAERSGQSERSTVIIPEGRCWRYAVRDIGGATRHAPDYIDALTDLDDPWPGRLAWPYSAWLAGVTRMGLRHRTRRHG